EGGILRNAKGERFMERYDPKKLDLSSRDVVSRSIYKEVQAGRGSPHGGAFLDITHRGAEFIKKKLPSMYEQFLSLADIDITKTPMEVAPTIHYVMGGVRVEAGTGASSVPGLFAAGEVAAGLHGANRLGGNSLSDLLVFGQRAGKFAARFAKEHGDGQANPGEIEEAERRALEPFGRRGDGTEGPYAIQHELQEMMQDLVGIVRTETEMVRALEGIDRLRQRARRVGVQGNREYNPGWHTALDLENLLTISAAITLSALERKE